MATSVANLSSSCSCSSSIAACSQQRLSSASSLRASPLVFSHHRISSPPNDESYSLTDKAKERTNEHGASSDSTASERIETERVRRCR
ncbi:hypothetical protein CBR_g31991 [Chara braunii]|uniref:Uncharacterized protein n=1 Tax=Chara braunii TaxID=69332 RepID=A0A388LG74_CHABU|nr:hypothetical protein CBR_g31991 [Chara braunii]|eukprot:GBG81316.1 hypothetical protein CBR_g31991 [Chara braunii]